MGSLQTNDKNLGVGKAGYEAICEYILSFSGGSCDILCVSQEGLHHLPEVTLSILPTVVRE